MVRSLLAGSPTLPVRMKIREATPLEHVAISVAEGFEDYFVC